jgi:hypothetical protein
MYVPEPFCRYIGTRALDLDPDQNPGPLIRKSLRKDCARILVLNPDQTLKLNLETRLSKLVHLSSWTHSTIFPFLGTLFRKTFL